MDNRWVDGWIMDDGALILVGVFIHVHKKEKTSPIKARQCKPIKDVFSVAADNGGGKLDLVTGFCGPVGPR